MRTLFLFGILLVLVIIAIKKPDQTAWEAARDLDSIVSMAISELGDGPEVQVVTENTRVDVEDLISEAGQASYDSSSSRNSSAKALDIGEPGGFKGFDTTVLEDRLLKSASYERIPDPQPSTDFTTRLPRSDVVDLPDLPAMPLTPVEVTEIEESAVSSLAPANLESDQEMEYREVKSSYENASRLLAEIE